MPSFLTDGKRITDGNGWKDDDDDDACRAGYCKRGIIVLSPTKKGRDTMQIPMNTDTICYDCGRRFNILIEQEAEEWFYGHDCEEA